MNIDKYDFLLNENNELILLFNGFDDEPEKPYLTLSPFSVDLTRSEKMPVLSLIDVPCDIIEKLEIASRLMICELNDDGEPRQVYETPIRKTFNS